jgi:hypothetical protein
MKLVAPNCNKSSRFQLRKQTHNFKTRLCCANLIRDSKEVVPVNQFPMNFLQSIRANLSLPTETRQHFAFKMKINRNKNKQIKPDISKVNCETSFSLPLPFIFLTLHTLWLDLEMFVLTNQNVCTDIVVNSTLREDKNDEGRNLCEFLFALGFFGTKSWQGGRKGA